MLVGGSPQAPEPGPEIPDDCREAPFRPHTAHWPFRMCVARRGHNHGPPLVPPVELYANHPAQNVAGPVTGLAVQGALGVVNANGRVDRNLLVQKETQAAGGDVHQLRLGMTRSAILVLPGDLHRGGASHPLIFTPFLYCSWLHSGHLSDRRANYRHCLRKTLGPAQIYFAI